MNGKFDIIRTEIVWTEETFCYLIRCRTCNKAITGIKREEVCDKANKKGWKYDCENNIIICDECLKKQEKEKMNLVEQLKKEGEMYKIKNCEKIMEKMVKFFEENNINFKFYVLSFHVDKVRIQGKFDPLTIQILLSKNAKYSLTQNGYVTLEINLEIENEQVILSFIMTD
jgi:hypothetical protein